MKISLVSATVLAGQLFGCFDARAINAVADHDYDISGYMDETDDDGAKNNEAQVPTETVEEQGLRIAKKTDEEFPMELLDSSKFSDAAFAAEANGGVVQKKSADKGQEFAKTELGTTGADGAVQEKKNSISKGKHTVANAHKPSVTISKQEQLALKYKGGQRIKSRKNKTHSKSGMVRTKDGENQYDVQSNALDVQMPNGSFDQDSFVDANVQEFAQTDFGTTGADVETEIVAPKTISFGKDKTGDAKSKAESQQNIIPSHLKTKQVEKLQIDNTDHIPDDVLNNTLAVALRTAQLNADMLKRTQHNIEKLKLIAGYKAKKQQTKNEIASIESQIEKVKSDPNMTPEEKVQPLNDLEGEKQNLTEQQQAFKKSTKAEVKNIDDKTQQLEDQIKQLDPQASSDNVKRSERKLDKQKADSAGELDMSDSGFNFSEDDDAGGDGLAKAPDQIVAHDVIEIDGMAKAPDQIVNDYSFDVEDRAGIPYYDYDFNPEMRPYLADTAISTSGNRVGVDLQQEKEQNDIAGAVQGSFEPIAFDEIESVEATLPQELQQNEENDRAGAAAYAAMTDNADDEMPIEAVQGSFDPITVAEIARFDANGNVMNGVEKTTVIERDGVAQDNADNEMGLTHQATADLDLLGLQTYLEGQKIKREDLVKECANIENLIKVVTNVWHALSQDDEFKKESKKLILKNDDASQLMFAAALQRNGVELSASEIAMAYKYLADNGKFAAVKGYKQEMAIMMYVNKNFNAITQAKAQQKMDRAKAKPESPKEFGIEGILKTAGFSTNNQAENAVAGNQETTSLATNYSFEQDSNDGESLNPASGPEEDSVSDTNERFEGNSYDAEASDLYSNYAQQNNGIMIDNKY